MSLHRFFLEDQVLSESGERTANISLSKDDIKHLKAARVSPGELVAVIDATSDYFQCEVLELTNDGFIARIASRKQADHIPFSIDLFQGIPKAGKLEDVVRHGTEIGINAFYPLACKRSVAKLDDKKAASKIERLQRVAKSAAMQSGRDAIPTVNMPVDFKQAIDLLKSYDSCVVFWEEAEGTLTLKEALYTAKELLVHGGACRVAVVVGPEGGIDESEIELLLSGVETSHLSTLGPNILRTETAGVVGCALVSYELGGMGAAPIDNVQSDLS